MNAEIKQKWIDALRSGRYQQGAGVLRDSQDKFCCLGVLCDLANSSGWGEVRVVGTCINSRDIDVDAYPYRWADDESETSLPNSLQSQFGLRAEELSKLISLNDSGNDFRFIAGHIERNIPAEGSRS